MTRYLFWKPEELYNDLHQGFKRIPRFRTAVILSCVFIYLIIVMIITKDQEPFSPASVDGRGPPAPSTELPVPGAVKFTRVVRRKTLISKNTNSKKSYIRSVAGWSSNINRDTKIYVQPNYTTVIHEPKELCLAKNKNKLFLFVIVCSALDNIERRNAIRETWGNRQHYEKSLIIFNKTQRYKDLSDQIKTVTKIPEYRLVFLLGKSVKNTTAVQKSIDNEMQKFDDIIQEDFIDSYNNLTLKSIMMLKWITNNCKDSVRYILKTDDDTYVNVPRLILHLNGKSQAFDSKVAKYGHIYKDYLLIGSLIRRAKPIRDSNQKWYCPLYMYNGKLYPKYLSGMAYVMSLPTALALYEAALRTDYFHLEDIYITGICASRAKPRIEPQNDPFFTYSPVNLTDRCHTYKRITAHRLTPDLMRQFCSHSLVEAEVNKCERRRHIKNAHVEWKNKLLLDKQLN